MTAKYIIFDDGKKEFGIIFPEGFCHECIARMVNKDIVSAGFVRQENGHIVVYGHSLSLGVNFRIEDATLLSIMIDESNPIIPQVSVQ